MKKIRNTIYWIIIFTFTVFFVYADEIDRFDKKSYWENITINDIKEILSEKKDILNAKTEEIYTFFTSAIVFCKNIDVIRYLIKQEPDLSVLTQYRQQPVLHLAIYSELPLEIIEDLINAGADINKADGYGMTALMYAMQHSNIPVIDLLLNKGASLDVVDNDGNGLEAYAWEDMAKSDIYQQRIKPLAKRSLPHTYTFWKSAQLKDILELAHSKYDFNQELAYDKTILMLAASSSDDPDVIRELIERSSNINHVSEYGNKNALFFAVANFQDNSKLPLIKTLITAGISPDVVDISGDNVLSYAFKEGTPELIEVLLDNGAKLPKTFNKKELLNSIDNNNNGLKNSEVYKNRLLPMITL